MNEKDYTIDELMEKTGNKYVLSEVISQRARDLKRNADLTIGYKAINQAVADLMEDRFTYEERKKK